MEWFKLFGSEEEARTKLKEHKPQLLMVNGKRICIVMHKGSFYAVQDSCSHNGESLSKGQVNYLGEIICPWHNYRFELSTGRACDSDCRELTTYTVKSDSSGFFIEV